MTSRRMRSLAIALIFAASSIAQARERPVDIESLIDLARAVPAEFSADILLRIAASPLVADPKWKRELLDEAFAAAAQAQWPYRRKIEGSTDTREYRAAWDNGLDALALQTRAVEAMLPLDPRRALAMFVEIRMDGLSDFSCRDALIPDVQKYYTTLPQVVERAFTPKERKEEADVHFVDRLVRNVKSPVQVAPAGRMLFEVRIAPEQRQRLLNAFAVTLDGVPANYRLFERSATDTAGIAFQALRAGLDVSALMPALHSYLVRNLTAPRCSGAATPSFPRRFNALVQELNAAGAAYPLISDEEQRAFRDGGTYRVTDYWQSPRSKQVLEDLRWLNHGNRDLPDDRRFWTLEERSTSEWNVRYLELMKLLEGWKEDEESSQIDFFHMKANAFGSLARLVPPGRARDNALLTWLSFLEQSYASVENRNDWFTEFQFLLPGKGNRKDSREAAYLLEEMARSRNPVIALYARTEKLLRVPAKRD